MALQDILARIERRLSRVGLKDDGAAKLAGKRDAIRNMRRAVKEGRNGVNSETLEALAPVLKTTAAWLLEASGPEELDDILLFQPKKPMVPVIAYAGAGAEMHFYVIPEGSLDEVEAPENATKDTKAVEIRGTCFGAIFDRWYAFFDDVREPVTPDLVKRLCVVGLDDGRTLIKVIERGSREDRYTLSSEYDDDIEDVVIVWAAIITSMRPR